MCEICGSMLAAEHTEQPGAEVCPKCHRFPLDAEPPLDLSQWDYVAPELRDAAGSGAAVTQNFVDSVLEQAVESTEDTLPEETDEEDESEERVRTCYHCYQAGSGLAERCPVCGDSYLPPFLRKHRHA